MTEGRNDRMTDRTWGHKQKGGKVWNFTRCSILCMAPISSYHSPQLYIDTSFFWWAFEACLLWFGSYRLKSATLLTLYRSLTHWSRNSGDLVDHSNTSILFCRKTSAVCGRALSCSIWWPWFRYDTTSGTTISIHCDAVYFAPTHDTNTTKTLNDTRGPCKPGFYCRLFHLPGLEADFDCRFFRQPDWTRWFWLRMFRLRNLNTR
jgi:hypothetical protein